MKLTNILLAGIAVLLVAILVVSVVNYAEEQEFRNMMRYDQPQIDKIVQVFKEHYSNYEITEYPNSDNVTWKYTVETSYANVELILGDDRVILRSFDKSNETMCMIVNPYPKDVVDWCPQKW